MKVDELISTLRNTASGATHHMAAIAGVGVLTVLGASVAHFFGTCTEDLKKDVAVGESYLFAGHVKEADAIADDSLVVGPRCGCVSALKAEVERARMDQAVANSDAAGAESHREACYAYAEHAWSQGEKSPRVSALIKTCKATVA